MKQRLHIFQLIAALVLCTITCDLAYSAVNTTLETDSVFLYESESEESSEDLVPQLVPQLALHTILLFKVPEAELVSLTFLSPDRVNFSPHGWTVPIFIDDCVYRL